MVRDQALAPERAAEPQDGRPVGLPAAAGRASGRRRSTASATWTTSAGEDRYRRGLYTFWRRTVPYPSMATFDAPSREICTVRRVRTNTPLQAFVTLNDPVYVEAAQALARRIVAEGGVDAEDRVRFGLAALPGPARRDREQVEPLVDALSRRELDHYRGKRRRGQGDGDRPARPAARRAWTPPSWPPGRRWPTCC